MVAVIPFEDEDDAVRLANDTVYGLSGSVWTQNVARAMRVARRIEAGVLSINSNTSVRVATPFGGMKQSGVGRELGVHVLHVFGVCNVGVDVEAPDLISHLVAWFVGEVHHANPGVLLGESPGRLAAYAAGTARYDGDFPFEEPGHN